MWGVVVAVLGLTCLGKLSDWSNQTAERDRANLVFGDFSVPAIRQMADSNFLNIARTSETRFYTIDASTVDSATDNGSSDGEIRFVDPSNASTGWVRCVTTVSEDWPPPRNQFSDALLAAGALRTNVLGQTKRRRITSDEPDETEAYQLERFVMSLQRAVQVTEVNYDGETLPGATANDATRKKIATSTLTVNWACPSRSAAWPVRAHLGRCTIGGQSLLIGVHELAAKSGPVDYRSGVFHAIAQAIRTSPLGIAAN